MDSLIAAAARALVAGDTLGALKRVALRNDPVGASPVHGRTFGSICDVCLNAVTGRIERAGEDVLLIRDCPTHGARRFLVRVCNDGILARAATLRLMRHRPDSGRAKRQDNHHGEALNPGKREGAENVIVRP